MYYTNGNYSMGGNFKIKKQAPMDDRSTVAKKIDLQNPNLFDGFTYNGMIVSVVDDTINNGIYRLEDKSTKTWVKEGNTNTGGTTGGGDSFTVEDKTKLDGIEAEATKNKTDGFLLSRSNHTGTIPMSVVESLEQKLANISAGGSMNSFNGRTGNVSPKTGDYASDMITETTEKQFVSNDEKISWNSKLADASMDSKLYGRMNGGWVEITGSGGGTNVEIVAITNKLDAKGIEANKVLVSNGDDTSEWKDYNTYSYTESGAAPLNPKLGDDWRDTANEKLYKWSNIGGVAQWSEIGTGSSSGGLDPNNDIILSTGKGVVMTSDNGTIYKLYIDNDGRLTTEVV